MPAQFPLEFKKSFKAAPLPVLHFSSNKKFHQSNFKVSSRSATSSSHKIDFLCPFLLLFFIHEIFSALKKTFVAGFAHFFASFSSFLCSRCSFVLLFMQFCFPFCCRFFDFFCCFIRCSYCTNLCQARLDYAFVVVVVNFGEFFMRFWIFG